MSTANLRDGWTVRSLESIAEEVIRRVPDPRTSGLDRFVSSSCIDRHDVRVTRWEATSEVVSAAKRFESGDYLLVRRSLYATDFRERAPRADFAGVCSADILTIRERQGELAPGFLQYLLYDKGFWDFIVANSTGSITRRIKWRQIAKYEFALPPIDEQQRILEVLGAVETLGSRLRESIGLIGDVEAAIVAEVARTEGASEQPLQSCCAAPISYGIVQPGLDVPDGIPYVNVDDMTAGPLSRTTLPRTLPAISARHGRTLLQPGDVVVALRGQIGLAAVVSEELAGVNLSRGVARLHPNPAVDGGYLALCLSSPTFRAQIRSAATGSTFKELKIGALRELRVPVPSLDRQREIAESVGRVRRAQAATAVQIATTVEMRQALLNRLLQGAVDVH